MISRILCNLFSASALLLLALFVSAPAQAQVAFDRQLRGVELVPDAAGGVQGRAYIRLSGSDDGAGPYDLSFEVETSVNDGGINRFFVVVETKPSAYIPGVSCEVDCGSNCGGLYIDGVFNSQLCSIDGVYNDPTGPGHLVDCDCGYWLNFDLGTIPAGEGDEIMVELIPLPGSVPSATDDHKKWIEILSIGQATGAKKKVKEIVVVGSKVIPFIEVQASELRGTVDLSFEAVLHVNGVPTGLPLSMVAATVAGVGNCETASACNQSCGSILVGQNINTLVCKKDGLFPDGTPDCDCGIWFAMDGWNVDPLAPGDEIMVLLRPAPGSLPSPGGEDDRMSIVYEGEDRGWNREIGDVALVDDASGRFLDVEVLLQNTETDQFRPMGYQLQVFEGTQLIGEVEYDMDFLPEAQPVNCSLQNCHTTYCQGIQGNHPNPNPSSSCQTWANTCTCTVSANTLLALPPGSVGPFVVLLRPVPGALPELPGFEEDEERFDPRATDVPDLMRDEIFLESNVPNPFNPITTIAFNLPRASDARLEIHDLRGQRVAILHRGLLPAGRHEVQWDGLDTAGNAVASGTYFYTLIAADERLSKRMLLAK